MLKNGKEKFDFLTSEYQKLYGTNDWWGFYQLWLDWKGHRWLLPYLCKWHKGNLPEWLDKEDK